MSPANLSLIALLSLIVWRLVFAGLHRRLLVKTTDQQQQRRANILAQGFHALDLARAAVIPDNRLENGSDAVPVTPQDRAKTYLRRIAALTGATQIDDAYVLDIGKMRFHVRDRYVGRLRDVSNLECGYEETCFYPVHKGMPKAEEIATALLQLTNNPALFDKWAVQNGLAFKADGQVFTRAH
jgi:hypothetical protein